MALELHFAWPLATGLHARPASRLATLAGRYRARITLQHARTGSSVDAASVLALVALAVEHGDWCALTCEGSDEMGAHAALQTFIRDELPLSEAAAADVAPPRAGSLPRLLADAQVEWLSGQPLSPGVGRGRIVRVSGLRLPDALQSLPAGPVEIELARLDRALAAVLDRLAAQLVTEHGAAADVLQAGLALAADPELHRLLRELVTQEYSAAQAAVIAVQRYASRVRESDNVYLAERAADIEDIGLQLLEQFGVDAAETPTLTEPSVVVAATLAPRQFLALERTLLSGLVLSQGGSTAHIAILARALGVPAISGIDVRAPRSARAVVDGRRGLLYPGEAPAVLRFYQREQLQGQRQHLRASAAVQAPAAAGSPRVEVAANIATHAEAAQAVELGAEGVGLLRTELLFAGFDPAPTEEQQYEVLRGIVDTLQGRPLIVRTYDIGGDKPLPYIPLPREANPFLGYRGIRIYAQYRELLLTQLRAILRAAAHGPVKVMAPMVSDLAEVRLFRQFVDNARELLSARGAAAATAELPVGVMLEVPAAALSVAQLSAEVDFFSLGTNDLTQYLLAVDRDNSQVAAVYNDLHPALLRLLRLAVDEAHVQGRWIGLCGELASRLEALPLLAGLGLDELSVSAAGIPTLHAALARLDAAACRELLARACNCGTAGEVEVLLREFERGVTPPPLLSHELIELDSDCTTVGEALHELASLLGVAGRTTDVEALEDALWAREATFATGIGHGIAIPHCQSESISAASLALLRTSTPLAWGSLDAAPVQTVLLLALPAGAATVHLKLLARLARRLMDEQFRAALSADADSSEIMALLSAELTPPEE